MKHSILMIFMLLAFTPIFAQTAPASSQVQKDINKILNIYQ
jgi:ABC-type nitrate/sulfonate/bicarbonate transport system permease component